MEVALIVFLSMLLAGYWVFDWTKYYQLGVISNMGYHVNDLDERSYFADIIVKGKNHRITISRDVYYSSRVGQNFAILI